MAGKVKNSIKQLRNAGIFCATNFTGRVCRSRSKHSCLTFM